MRENSYLIDSAAPLFSHPKVYALALGIPLERCGVPAEIALRLENAAHRAGMVRGEVIASERQLTAFFSTSRDTLRQAIRIVEQRGSMRMLRGRYGGLCVERPDAKRVGTAMASYLLACGCTIADVRRAVDLIDPLLVRSATRAGFPGAEIRGARVREEMAQWAPEAGLRLYAATIAAVTMDPGVAGASGVERTPPPALLAAGRSWASSNGVATSDPDLPPVDPGDGRPAAPSWDTGEARGAQMATALLHRIFTRGLQSGARLGAEWELACEFDTSRAIIRQGVSLLEDIDVLAPQRGRGGGFVIKRPSPAGIVRQVHPFLAQGEGDGAAAIDLVGELNAVHLKLAVCRLAEMPRAVRRESLRVLAAFGSDGDPEETSIRALEEIGRIAANPLVDTLLRCLVACHARAYRPPRPMQPPVWATIYRHHREIVRALDNADADTAEYHFRATQCQMDRWVS